MSKWRWVAVAIVVVLLAYAATKVDWHATALTLRHAAPLPLLAAVLVNVASVALRGVRWWIFLRPLADIPLSVATRGAIVGAGFNNLLVANGGDAARVLLVARSTGVSRSSVLATLALDRIFDPICFGLLLFSATFLVPLPSQLAGARWVTAAALAGAAVVLMLLARRSPHDGEAFDTGGWRNRIASFRRDVQSLSTGRYFGLATLVSLTIWVMQIGVFALVAESVGIDLPIAGSIGALLLTNTGLVLRATPGNVGYFQVAYAAAAAQFNVPTDQAVATALLLQFVQIVPLTLIAVMMAPRLLDVTRAGAPE